MYAIHSIIVKKSMPLDEAVKSAKDISKKKKIFMRELKNTYHFRNIPKTKFEKKSFRSKIINPEITLVFAKLKPEYEHLGSSKMSGEGIFSDLINLGIRKAVPRVVSALVKTNEFNNVSTKTLQDFGSYTIRGMQIYRTPISGILNSAMNLISLGKWNDLRKKYGYDNLFHTALVCDIGGKNVIVEKNEVVNISTSYKTSKDTQTYHINMEGKTFTLNDMVYSCKNKMGDKLFFDYDAFSNNCQVFIKNMLQAVGLYNANVDRFLFQDLSKIYKELPSYTSKIAKLITKAGAFVSRLRGDGNGDEPSKFKAKLMSNTEFERNKDTILNNFRSSSPVMQKLILNKYNSNTNELLSTLSNSQKQELEPLLTYEDDMRRIGESERKDETYINKYPVEFHDEYFDTLTPVSKSNLYNHPKNFLPVYSKNYQQAKERFEKNVKGGAREDDEEVNLGHHLRREEEKKAEEKKEEPLILRGKCTRGTPFGECFNKGFKVGYYLAYNPLMRQNKAKLLELCEKYDCPDVDENTTAKQMKEKLKLMGTNVDLLDKILEQQEIELEQAIRADKEKRRAEGNEIDKNLYHKKKQRFNPPLGSLTVRDMVLLCKQYNCGSVNGKSYANMNRNELIEVLENAGYKERRV